MQTNDATPLQPLLAAITIMGSGRLGPTVAALLGLIGTVIGGLALIRSNRRNHDNADNSTTDARVRATAAFVLGLISLVLGGLFLATADGGPGTGNGVVGSGAAIVLGPIAIILGGLTRARRRAAGSTSRVQPAPAPPAYAKMTALRRQASARRHTWPTVGDGGTR
jgi:hypothetical protein